MSNDEITKAMTWLMSDDTGISSKAIMARMLDGVVCSWHDYPHDAGDLGRCLRLLDRIPAWKPRIGEMAACGPIWEALVKQWDALAEAAAFRNGIRVHGMIRRIVDTTIRTDPRFDVSLYPDGAIRSYRLKTAEAA